MTSTARRIALATAADHPAAGGGRKQCWECQRRRVVCDAVRPVCGKCKATGVVCPGYEDKKPLTWLAPGKVKTRTWKRKKPATKKESVETFANSTSPADDQSEPNHSYDNIDLIAELYQSGYYPFLPCPVELFTDIIRINYLRYLIATDGLPEDMGTPQSASEDLIEDIIEFSPEAWAETREADVREELLLMAQAYQSAIALYVISSLQGLRALPSSAGWRAVRTIHYSRLISLLEKAAEAPLMKNCVEWPLIVAGFEASTGSAAGRVMVVKQLVSMSQDLGTYLPLAAVGMLEKFWSSGKRTWDDCFDEPYALFA
ncbi:C6 zinc finger domain protein [Colletotrichum asianum]|uniref:C6 zinc finger domain protein n=1 Tax=Colletotrichum asianum TaxID=702518 RepID=A0A8H3W181_9PEZI|nr:C6 zinc finger domain protein [Colletotrichum asianum]